MLEHQRVAETFARAGPGHAWEFGSGYQITRRLVLTSAHVVVFGGVPAPDVVVRLLGTAHKLAARVVWWRADELVDAAVVEIRDPGHDPPEMSPVRWGWLTGQRGGLQCEAIGFPDALRGTDWRDSEHLKGAISPGSRVKAHHHDVLVDSEPDDPSQWNGISGSAVFCGELLTGVLIVRPPGFGGRRLTAVPAGEILRDPGFAALAGAAELESVELCGLFDPPVRWNLPDSAAYLLRADAEVVPFRGRSGLLSELEQWCGAPAAISARLITGPGGQGKTRLARELARRLRPAGWVTGWLTQPADGQPLGDQWDLLAEATVPVLVIIDYAETRTEQISRLINRVGLAQRPGLQLRLLLLARSRGDWWRALAGTTPAVERSLEAAKAVELPPLERTEAGRAAVFRAATEHFALALPQPGSGAGADWISLAAAIEPPADLAHPRYRSVLALHMAALAALLQAGPAPVPAAAGDNAEDVLLRHEDATGRKQPGPGAPNSSTRPFLSRSPRPRS